MIGTRDIVRIISVMYIKFFALLFQKNNKNLLILEEVIKDNNNYSDIPFITSGLGR